MLYPIQYYTWPNPIHHFQVQFIPSYRAFIARCKSKVLLHFNQNEFLQESAGLTFLPIIHVFCIFCCVLTVLENQPLRNDNYCYMQNRQFLFTESFVFVCATEITIFATARFPPETLIRMSINADNNYALTFRNHMGRIASTFRRADTAKNNDQINNCLNHLSTANVNRKYSSPK